MIDAFCNRLKRLLSCTDASTKIEVLASQLADFFQVEVHEVGLFRLDADGRATTFLWPPHRLGRAIKIPVSSFASALVATTARERHGTIDNTFAKSQHLFMFEHALLEKEHCLPIQKVMCAPAVKGDQLEWIIQISRKGRTLEDAGLDFTARDLSALEKVAGRIVELDI